MVAPWYLRDPGQSVISTFKVSESTRLGTMRTQAAADRKPRLPGEIPHSSGADPVHRVFSTAGKSPVQLCRPLGPSAGSLCPPPLCECRFGEQMKE